MIFIRSINKLNKCKLSDIFQLQCETRSLHLAPPFLVEDYTPVAIDAYKSGLLKVKLYSKKNATYQFLLHIACAYCKQN